MPVIANKMFIASVASGHTALAPVDVCKTPTPPVGPIPIPYPNIAMSAIMGPGYSTKTMATFTPIWTKKGKTAITNGDQPGVAGGIMSSMIMGPCSLLMASFDVMIEGAGAGRTLDMSDGNKENKGVGTLIHAGAAAVPLSPQGASCKAFRASVEAWCSKKPGEKQATFNDYFFKALEKDKPRGTALAESLKTDSTTSAAQDAGSIAARVARGSGQSASTARRVLQTSSTVRGSGGGSSSASLWASLSGKWLASQPTKASPRVPAGTLDNAAIEVKAPGDSYEPGKLEEYQQQSVDRKVVEVSGESCGEECAKGNRCQ
jgi:hypothetical protein